MSIENRILRVFRLASGGDRRMGDKAFSCQDAIDPASGCARCTVPPAGAEIAVQRHAVEDSAAAAAGMSLMIPLPHMAPLCRP